MPASRTGLPPTRTVGLMPTIGIGISLATTRHGAVAGVGGWAQPTIGEPTRSPTHIAGMPPTRTLTCLGMSVTWPPWAHMILAPELMMGLGIALQGTPRSQGGRRPIGWLSGHGSAPRFPTIDDGVAPAWCSLWTV